MTCQDSRARATHSAPYATEHAVTDAQPLSQDDRVGASALAQGTLT